jgi:carbamoyltransferase
MKIIAVNTLHDSAISVFDGVTLHNLELERITRERYLDLSGRADAADVLAAAMGLLVGRLGVENRFDLCLHHGGAREDGAVRALIRADVHRTTHSHHEAHAATALYASPFREALIVSFDGGGYDGVFNVYTGRRGEDLRVVARLPLNLGTSYRAFAHPIGEIRKRPFPPTAASLDLAVELAAAGKLMGLAAYGTPRREWRAGMEVLMRTFGHGGPVADPGVRLRSAGLPCRLDELTGRDAFDFAATAQLAFEELFFEAAGPYLRESELPVCLTGGAALNVLLNERVRVTTGRDVFVPPNPSDTGITAGLVLDVLRPDESAELAYTGWPLLDAEAVPGGARATPEAVAALLASGEVVGVARGRSEHGPRALGNRSILCDPGVPRLKDRLNREVKFREWFRPYAPVTRLESVGRYFEIGQPAPYMSFAPRVRPEWRDRLAAIVHEDGTARVQTVTAAQNPWLHRLLGEFEAARGHDVLLNTSLNTKGRPILTTAGEALELLRTTSLDHLVLEDTLVAG